MKINNKFRLYAASLLALLLTACDGVTTYDCGTTDVTTLAGSGSVGAADGVGTAATFKSPFGITSDGTHLYVADKDNHKIRKIVIASGTVTTLAGSGNTGAADGMGTAATFNTPFGITSDGTHLYVADSNNHKIRKIVIATGEVTTLAGSGNTGATDGMGTAAAFNTPFGITSDGTHLYVADSNNHKIRKIVIATGEVTTLAGSGSVGANNGTGVTATFATPAGITHNGPDLYVTELLGNKVRKVVIATGEVTTLAGSGRLGATDGTGTAAEFNFPSGITNDGTHLYVADSESNKIRKIVIATGVVTTLAGSGDSGANDGTGATATFAIPAGIATDSTSSTDGINIYVADNATNKIRKIRHMPRVCTNPSQFSIGGDISGLNGTLVLQNNGANDKTISTNGVFAFSRTVISGGSYNVTAKTLPTGQSCTIAHGSGTASANINNVTIKCVNTVSTIGGTVSGLSGTLVLQNNGGDDLSLTASGNFTFASSVSAGGAYNIAVKTQPNGQICSITNNSGTAQNNISNVTVTCASNTAYISGVVNGLNGSLVLQNNGTDDLSVNTNGSFLFATPVALSGPYSVSIKTQPTGQTCTLSGNSGTASADVNDIAVTCANNTYSVSGSVNGLTGSLVLQNNSSDNLPVSADGGFTFATLVPYGGTYAVSVQTQPAGQTCTVANSSGTLTANVSDVAVSCVNNGPATYTIGGVVNNLQFPTLVLQNNGGDDLSVYPGFPSGVSVPFDFATPISGAYSVTVITDPAGQTCSVTSGGSGTATANVSDIVIDCTP